jgi:uncharacterized protein (TIGR02231 family)
MESVAEQNAYSYDAAMVEESVVVPAPRVRGATSIVAPGKPLVVLDGQLIEDADESFINGLNPAIIKDIQILKDGSATSIYGARAMAGVIVVTTKSAKELRESPIEEYITTEDNALNITYNIDRPYSLPGNGKAQNIDLATKNAPAEFKYYAAPKLDGATYLIAEIADWQKLDLLSAPANVTYAGTYIGETAIDAEQTREKLTLTLGTDKRVATTRELVKEFSAAKTVGSNIEHTFTWKLTVRNGQTKPVFVVLKEQYPTSTDKAVTVTVDTKTTTPPTTNMTDTGVVTWEETIAAGAIKEYILSYTVRYPKDMTLNL